MKAVSILAALLAFGSIASAETAYEALRSLGQARGEDILNQVVEVSGKEGSPQPTAWTVVTADRQARGGVRVYGIREGRVESEHTPTSQGNAEPVPMDFNQLNLDSPGAFKVAEQEAVRNRVGFDRVDYVLQAGGRSASPVWVITLEDASGAPAATVEVTANNGEIASFRTRGGRQEEFVQEDRQILEDERVPSDDDRRDYRSEDSGSREGGFFGSMERFGRRVGRHFQRDGAALDRFFTGDTAIDPDEGSR